MVNPIPTQAWRGVALAVRSAWASTIPGTAARMAGMNVRHVEEFWPELMVLCGARGPGEARLVLGRIAALPRKTDPEPFLAALGGIGRLGFSFPLWRFPAMKVGNTTLLERAGMLRMSGAGDADLGQAFWWEDDGGWRFELRRACAVATSPPGGPGTLVIRNSSRHWGRDRLAAPAYWTGEDVSFEDLRVLTAAGIAADGRFEPLPGRLLSGGDAAIMIMIGDLIRRFDAFDLELSRRVADERELVRFAYDLAAEGRAMPWLAAVPADEPPWRPSGAVLLDQALAAGLARLPEGWKAALLSGPDGDLPA